MNDLYESDDSIKIPDKTRNNYKLKDVFEVSTKKTQVKKNNTGEMRKKNSPVSKNKKKK